MDALLAARSRVEGLLQKVLRTKQLHADDYGNWPVRYGSTMCFIRVVPLWGSDKHMVQIFSPLISDVPASPQLLEALNAINVQILFARVAWINGMVYAFSDLVAETLDEPELNLSCQTIGTIANTYHSALQSQLGGRICFPPPDRGTTEAAPVGPPAAPPTAHDERRLTAAPSADDAARNWRVGEAVLASQAGGWRTIYWPR